MKESRAKKFVAAILICLSIVFTSSKPKSTFGTTVYVFLSETCPICQSYTLTLKELHKKYAQQQIEFIGVFPNYYSTQENIDSFKLKYNLPFELMLDKNAELTKQFNATITPEVFVESENQVVYYSGRIDDTFYKVGKRRKVTNTSELEDALSAIVARNNVKVPKTQAVGCIISTKSN